MIAGSGRLIQKRVDKQQPTAVDSSKICRLTAEARRLRERLYGSDTHLHHLGIQLHSMLETFGNNKLEFSPLASEYYRLTRKRNQNFSKTNYERGIKMGRASDYCGGFAFQRNRYDEDESYGLSFWFHSCSCSPYSAFIKFMWFRVLLLLRLDICATPT